MRSFASLRATGRFVGIDGDVELVDVVELVRFGFGRAGHARELLVEPEVILNRDRREGLRFAVDLHAFLRFDRLVQPIAPAAARHLAAGVFVDDDDLVFLDDVLHVLLEEAVGAEELRDVVNPLGLRVAMLPGARLFSRPSRSSVSVGSRSISANSRDQIRQHEGVRIVRVQKVAALLGEIGFVRFLVDGEEQLFLEREQFFLARVRRRNTAPPCRSPGASPDLPSCAAAVCCAAGPSFTLNMSAAALLDLALLESFLRFAGEAVAKHGLLPHQLLDQRLALVVLMRRDRGRAADDERRARFVDQDGVDFVDDREVVAALHLLLARGGHAVVAQVIEAELASSCRR